MSTYLRKESAQFKRGVAIILTAAKRCFPITIQVLKILPHDQRLYGKSMEKSKLHEMSTHHRGVIIQLNLSTWFAGRRN